jgi:hypothetical protein
MPKSRIALYIVLAFGLCLVTASVAEAQYVSNRCYTNMGVCMLPYAAPAGSSCYCATPYGPAPGVVR